MIFLIFLIFLFAGCSSPVGYDHPNTYNHIKVTKVIDGDTVRLSNGKLLRYIGMDTPEVRIRKRGRFIYDPQPFSLEAKEMNRKLVENKFVRVELDVEKLDTYGRILGYCFVGDTFVNNELIKEGLAVLYTKPPDVKYTKIFIESQEQARSLHKGIWGNYKVVSSRDAHKFINQIRRVRGIVLDAYKSKRVVHLNFGRDYRTDFTVVIFNDCLKFFRAKGIEPEVYYIGKQVEVWGRIREYNGPEIIVSLPYQIRVLDEK